MTKGTLRRFLLGALMVGLSAPGLAVAGGNGKGCSLIGTWFGVDPVSHVLTGWMVTVEGKSNNEGTNNLECKMHQAAFRWRRPHAPPEPPASRRRPPQGLAAARA